MTENEKNTTGEIDPSIWDEAVAVTGRPLDQPAPNTTFGERAAASKPQAKAAAADDSTTENKAVKRASRKKSR